MSIFNKFLGWTFKDNSEMDEIQMPLQYMNPLTIDHLVEFMLSYFEKDLCSLKNSRLVCKVWDRESAKQMMKYFKRHERNMGTSVLFQSGEGYKFIDYLSHEKKLKLHPSGLDLGLEYVPIGNFIVSLSQCVKSVFNKYIKIKRKIQTIKNSQYPEFLSGLHLNNLFTSLGQKETERFLEEFGKHFKYLQYILCLDNPKEPSLEILQTSLSKWCLKLRKLKIIIGPRLWDKLPREIIKVSQPLWFLREIELMDTPPLSSRRFEPYPPQLEDFLTSLLEQCFNLRSLKMFVYQPHILTSIMNMRHITDNLEKLEIRYSTFREAGILVQLDEFISTIPFQKLSSLKLNGFDIRRDSADLLLQAYSNSLTELTMRWFMDERNPNLPGCAAKVLHFLPNLKSLKLYGVYGTGNYHGIFQDLMRYNTAHHNLVNFQLVHTERHQQFPILIGNPLIQPAGMQLSVLRDIFPNLKFLGLSVVRETNFTVPLGFLKEICTISSFPKLQTLKMDIDDFSIGENVFMAIGMLQRTKLKCLRLENTCRSCHDSEPNGKSCAHRESCRSEDLKDMVVKLRHLDKIQLINFHHFFGEKDAMKKTVNFSKKFENIEIHVIPRRRELPPT